MAVSYRSCTCSWRFSSMLARCARMLRALPSACSAEAVLQATADLYDEEGFIRTGDVVEQRGPDELVWIDRASNVVKLSQVPKADPRFCP